MRSSAVFPLFALVLGLLTGCDGDRAGPNGSSDQKALRIGFVARQANDYWALVRSGCDFAVTTLGDVELDFRTPAGRTAADQNRVLSNLVASGVQAIAISPIDGDAQAAALNAVPAHVVLVCADNDAEKSRRVAYIGTDNVAAGTQAADLIKAALPQGGNIVLLVGSDTAQNARERIQGITNGLAGSGIKVLETLVDGMSPTAAVQNAHAAMANHADLAGMVGLYSYNGPAILTAVRGAGKTGQLKIVCFDTDADTLNGISTGEIYGTIAQSPFKIGNGTVTALAKYLRGDKTALSDGKVLISSNPVTQENVGAYKNLSDLLKE
jgi:ribose transport system substrate-binding protein